MASKHKLGEKTQAWQANIYIETKHKHGKQAQPWQANTTRLASGDKDDKQTQAWQTNTIIAIKSPFGCSRIRLIWLDLARFPHQLDSRKIMTVRFIFRASEI